MATTTPFSYNTGSTISGTLQVGDLAVGTTSQDYSVSPGGVPWWMGPDEELGYVIATPVSGNTQPTPIIISSPTKLLTLSTTYIGNDINLSNGNQTALQQFGYQQTVLGNAQIDPTSKVMFSVLFNTDSPSTLPQSRVIGIGRTTMNYKSIPPYGAYPGNDDKSMGYCADGTILYNGSVYASGFNTWTHNDIIDIVVNNNVNTMWVRVNGGNWNNNPSDNPETNTGGFEIINGPFYPALCPGYQGVMTIQNISTSGTPSGYTLLGSNQTASVGFYRTKTFTDNDFISLSQYVSSKNNTPQTFSSATDASIWLTNNGFWNSYITPVLYLDAGNSSSYPGSGTTWTDLIGGKVFDLINGPTYDSGNGGKINFNSGSSQYAECSNSLPSLSTWTVGVWTYYTGTITEGSCIITEVYPGVNGNINYTLGNVNGGFRSAFFNGGWRETPTYNLTPNNWYYIVGTYDGTTISLYVNGTLVQSTNYSGSILSSEGGIRLMRRWDLGDYWDGYLSTVQIYNKSLDSTQVSSIWNSTKSRYGL